MSTQSPPQDLPEELLPLSPASNKRELRAQLRSAAYVEICTSRSGRDIVNIAECIHSEHFDAFSLRTVLSVIRSEVRAMGKVVDLKLDREAGHTFRSETVRDMTAAEIDDEIWKLERRVAKLRSLSPAEGEA